MQLGEKLQLLRSRNGMSQEELAGRLGISRQSVSKWESGQSVPDLKKLIILSDIYNVTSAGIISLGVLSFGCMSIGIISLAAISIALLLAIGVISIGTFSIGVISIGIFSMGALSIGKCSIGAAAIASDIAIGDYARVNIAIGNKAQGANVLPLDTPIEDIKILIKKEYPNISAWLKNCVEFFVRNIKL